MKILFIIVLSMVLLAGCSIKQPEDIIMPEESLQSDQVQILENKINELSNNVSQLNKKITDFENEINAKKQITEPVVVYPVIDNNTSAFALYQELKNGTYKGLTGRNGDIITIEGIANVVYPEFIYILFEGTLIDSNISQDAIGIEISGNLTAIKGEYVTIKGKLYGYDNGWVRIKDAEVLKVGK